MPADAEPTDPVSKAKLEAQAGHESARFWRGFDVNESVRIATGRMDAALDQLLELGIGTTTPAR